jgi:hypothetical protein
MLFFSEFVVSSVTDESSSKLACNYRSDLEFACPWLIFPSDIFQDQRLSQPVHP